MFREVVCRRWEMWFVSLLALVAPFAVMAVAPGEADASTGITSYRYTSEPGDYIGDGEQNYYTAAVSSISIKGTSADLTVVIERGGETWDMQLAAPKGERLHPGRYYDAERAPFRTGVAGLDVSGDGRGCNSSTGTLTIDRITFNAAGQVATLNASFVQQCEGAAPALRGKIRYYA